MSTYIKRRVSAILAIILFVLYYMVVDPDTKLFQNLPYGSFLILTLNIFVIAVASIIVIEFIPDFFIDAIYGKEKDLREKASMTSEGASNAMIAKSIRMLAYAIITAAAIISYSMN